MMHCPLCGHTAHTRSSRYLTEKTKERYHQCRNVDCSCTFATHETVARLIVKPQLVSKAESIASYSKRVVNNSYLHLGIFEGRELVGVMQWGYAMNPSSGSKIVSGTSNRGYMELNRLWVHDRMPRNTESRAISYALKTIKLLYPAVEWVQTFADERCGRFGVVYQASNFDYVGSHKSTFYELDGEWYHKIALTTKASKAGARGLHLQANKHRATAHTFNQFRYIKFLNKRARKRLNTKLFNPQPYPKPENKP